MDPIYQDCILLHVDADGFFASVEQALNPALRGRPVATGAERGIIAAASYEAKARGVSRSLTIQEAKTLCPDLVIVPSDYESYALYSQRMFAILRRYTPLVEEYSIDEAFADLSGCGHCLNRPLEDVAAALRQDVHAELGITVSVGISLSKTLAKACSKFRKPNGQTIVRREHLSCLLRRIPIGKVWRIGPASTAKLQARGIDTAEAFTQMDPAAVLHLLHQPGFDTWREVRGSRAIPLDLQAKQRWDTMMKGHTFAPPSNDPRFIFAEAIHNLGAAFAKLRRHGHLAKELGLSLREKDYTHSWAAQALPQPTCHDAEAALALRVLFQTLFVPVKTYRSTFVWLGGLLREDGRQLDLFTDTPEREALGRLDAAVDQIRARYGQEALAPAGMLNRRLKPVHARDAAPGRFRDLLAGEGARRLAIPRLTLTNAV